MYEYLETFLQYEWLWKDNKSIEYEKFIRKKPSLEASQVPTLALISCTNPDPQKTLTLTLTLVLTVVLILTLPLTPTLGLRPRAQKVRFHRDDDTAHRARAQHRRALS